MGRPFLFAVPGGKRGIVSIHLAILLLLSLLIWTGCDDSPDEDFDTVPEYAPPEIGSTATPEFWEYENELYRQLVVELDLPDDIHQAVLSGAMEAPFVLATIYPIDGDPMNGTSVQLHDDGNTIEYTSIPDYQDLRSNDLVPKDFTYSVMINSLFAEERGEYIVEYKAEWLIAEPTQFMALPPEYADRYRIECDTLVVEINNAPVVEGFDVPDSLHSGFDSQVWTANVNDEDLLNGDVITRVELHLFFNGQDVRTVQLAQASGDMTTWTLSTSASFAASYPTGDYLFRVIAWDQFEKESIPPFQKAVWMENTAPVLTDLVAPDTVYRPLEGVNFYDCFLIVEDLQGQGDIDVVLYGVRSPGREDFVIDPLALFNDDGIVPDETADDRTWSHRFKTEPDRTNFGTYTFRFYAIDRAGNESEFIDKDIEYLDGGGDQ